MIINIKIDKCVLTLNVIQYKNQISIIYLTDFNLIKRELSIYIYIYIFNYF